MGAATASARLLLIPVTVFAYTLIISPLIEHLTEIATFADVQSGRLENKLFWPLVSLLSLSIAIRNPRAVFSNLPQSIIALFFYFALAGLSVLWAFKPLISFTRYAQQMMLISALVIPVLSTARSVDLMRRLYICFIVAAIINLVFVLAGTQTIWLNVSIGYSGYLTHKNVLGQFAAFALFFSLREITFQRTRRYVGLVMFVLSVYLLVMSNSKTSIALGVALPMFVVLLTTLGRYLRTSPSTLFFWIVGLAVIACIVLSISVFDISEKLFRDRTFTGRTEIWEFVSYEIQKRPFLGWGFQSFWLVGLDGPSFTEGWGWIKTMPSAHSGYLDVELSTGRIGLALMLIYIVLTLTAVGRVCARDAALGRLLFSVALFVILSNFLESTFLEGHGFHWPLFVLVSLEAARQGWATRSGANWTGSARAVMGSARMRLSSVPTR